MQTQFGNRRIIGLVLAGNALDYYDFMLFAHLGSVITKVFFPALEPTQVHLLSLLLFAIPFVVRPIGGYVFGVLSDKLGRGHALGQTLKYAAFASAGIALLPGYEYGGLISMVLFVGLRALQGLSLGGEFTTAGTILLEKYDTHRSLLSAVVGSSGTVGSLIAFGFSWFYLNGHLSEDAWRIAFGLGSLATYLSFYFRQKLKKEMVASPSVERIRYDVSKQMAIWLSVLTGVLIGVIFWIPMVYVNFYMTKILHYPASVGLNATLTALLGSIFLTPLVGYLSDRFTRPEIMMTIGAILSIPLSIIGFLLIQHGYLIGQIFLILSVVIFGAPQHAVMNPLFPPETRSRYVNTLFMLGASIGSLVPVVSGYIVDHYGFHQAPLVSVVFCGIITSVVFCRSFLR
jgi:MHS family proline/betaine transporter-like MFS transporter